MLSHFGVPQNVKILTWVRFGMRTGGIIDVLVFISGNPREFQCS
jgi:hypothetical protein